MTPPTAILGGFTVALLIGAAGNSISLSSNAAAPNGAAACSSPSAPVGAAGVSVAQSSNGQENFAPGRDWQTCQPRSELREADARFEPSPALLSAIRHVESAGSDVSTPNHAGALGPYQMLEPTWNDHARGVPWAMATDEPTARVVAARYLAWIEQTLTKWQGRPATVEQVCGAWHSGIGNLRRCGYDVSKLGPEGRGFVRKVIERMEVHGGE